MSVSDNGETGETGDNNSVIDVSDVSDITDIGDVQMLQEEDLPGPSQGFFIVLGLAQLLAYFFLWVLEPTGDQAIPFFVVIGGVYILFIANFAIRAFRAPSLVEYLRHHWIGAITILFPFVLSLRFVFHLLVALARWYVGLQRFLVARGFHFVLLIAVVLIFLFSGLVYRFEHATNPEFDNYGASLWWAMATVTTIGYGDVVPITFAGRFVGTGLMLVGIGVFGALTANLSAFFVEASRARRARSGRQVASDSDIEQNRRLDRIIERLESLERTGPQPIGPVGNSSSEQSLSPTPDASSKTP
jgi:voltage-gated potassium channel